jgi:hypothetical protein
VSSQDLMDGRGAGDETAVCDSPFKLVLFGTHTKRRLGRMLIYPVRSTSALVPAALDIRSYQDRMGH